MGKGYFHIQDMLLCAVAKDIDFKQFGLGWLPSSAVPTITKPIFPYISPKF